MGFQPLATLHASDAVLTVENTVGAAIGIEYRRRIGKLFNPPARFLATRAIAGGVHNRCASHFQHDRAAPARGSQESMPLQHNLTSARHAGYRSSSKISSSSRYG